jgi:abortive infection bacteriophage resistance protein
VQDQIKLLKNRGLEIPDEAKAERYLLNISYYRLSGYMYPFLKDKKQHLYKKGSTFDDILNLYRFDRELRLMIFSAIEKIEV